MRAVKTIYQIVWNFIKRMERDHVSAYAAQAAYFIMLSFIPIIMLLLALLKYTPVTQAELQRIFEGGVPDSVYPMILQIINEVYSRSSTLIPMTALVTVWSAGRGVLALTRGFNCIYKVDETRNYVRLRIRSSGYTVLFIISVVLSLTVMVFGNAIHELFSSRLKIFAHITGLIISVRTIMMLCILVTFFHIDLPLSAQPQRGTDPSAGAGGHVHGGRLVGILVFLLDLCGSFWKLYENLRQPDDADRGHALAVHLHVYRHDRCSHQFLL